MGLSGEITRPAPGRSQLKLTILLVEESAQSREAWVESLREGGHRVFAFASPRSALESLDRVKIDAAFLSFRDPDRSRELQARLKRENPSCQVTLITDRPSEDRDAQALESGAREVLLRPFPIERLGALVDRVGSSRERRLPRPVAGGVETLLGRSTSIEQVRRLTRQVASSPDTSVLITGESGTGKELVARAVHSESHRAQQPFLEINCAAIPENLLESELFGHEAGAFTNASRAKPGLFELADQGSLFLDEIGELGAELQAKLLRVIDTRTVRRVAGSESKKLDLRIIAATNRDLEAEVRDRRFRADLFHRLNVVHVHLPPLRERAGDIELLVEHFVALFCRKFGRSTPPPDDLLMERLSRYRWPGNVRELANGIERAVLLAEDRRLLLSDFPFLEVAEPRSRASLSASQIQVDFTLGPVPLEAVERSLIEAALAQASGNVSEAARLVGLGRGAFRYKLASHKPASRRRAG